jgi:hypothetical protein
MGANSYAVLLADIVHSREIQDFREWRDRRLDDLSRLHREENLISVDYAVTAWDEFQTLLPRTPVIPRIVRELRMAFYPRELRVAVGFGSIDSLPENKEPLNLAATGEAFERARAALDRMKGGSQKYRFLTSFFTGSEDLDLVLNLVYRLHDSLVDSNTERQWQTIAALEQVKRSERANQLEQAAAHLGVSESTVSRNLQRGHYWQMLETEQTLSRWLELEIGSEESAES